MKTRILIGITTAESVSYATLGSIYNLIVPDDCETILKVVHSYNVADGRNELVDIMFNEGCDYIFFVDSDVILPPNALMGLYGMDWYFSVGTYPRKELKTIKAQIENDETVPTTLYFHEDRNKEAYHPFYLPFSELEEGKIIPVDCCGLGCALIRSDLFEKIDKPYFFFAHEGDPSDPENKGYCHGEDMYFCRKVIQAGIQIWAHGSVLCGHIGNYVYVFPNRT